MNLYKVFTNLLKDKTIKNKNLLLKEAEVEYEGR